MNAIQFETLGAQLQRQLSLEQCMALADQLRRSAVARLGEVLIAESDHGAEGRRICPRCGHHDVVKHGKDSSRGRQRYRCRKGATAGCGRTFNALSCTLLAGLRRPDLWPALAQAMTQHVSLRDTAKAVGVAATTVHRWRHRVLRAQAKRDAAQVGGVVEADETYFRNSFKGSRGWKRGTPPAPRPPRYRGGAALRSGLSAEQVPVLTAVDRAGGVIEQVLQSRSNIASTLTGRIEPGSVLCSDGEPAYVAVAKAAKSEHRRIYPARRTWLTKAVGGKPRKPGRMGLGRVNAHHERLKTFVNRQARGVSTALLPDWLRWHRALRRTGFSPSELLTDLLIHT